MRPNFLQTFLLTVDTGSMAEAARRQNISPATAAQQISSLENEIGVELVHRVGKAVRPTEAGFRILEQARVLLQEFARLKALANLGEICGELRLGAVNTALSSIVPKVIQHLAGAYPSLRFHITSALSAELFDHVQSGEIDIAVCLHPQFDLPKTMAWQLLREESLVLIALAEFAGRDAHELLRSEPFIRYDRKQWGGQQVDRYLKEINISPHERIELSHLTAIATMVSEGLGVALVPDTVMPTSIAARVVRVPLPINTKPRQLGLLWQHSSIHEKLIGVFVDQAKVEAGRQP